MVGTRDQETLSLDRYSAEAKGLVAGAQALADERKHAEVEPLHLLVRGLDRDAGIAEVFRKTGADPVEVLSSAESALRKLPRIGGGVAYLSQRFLDMMGRAEREAERDRAQEVSLEHLLNALSQEIGGSTGDVLLAFHIGPGAFRPHLSALRSVPRAAAAKGADGKSADAVATYTRDLVAIARAGKVDPVIGRDAVVRRMLQILERRGKNHPLLVGEPGVGKTAVIRALAARVRDGDVPPNLADLRMLEFDSGAIVAGAKLRGELEERVKKLMDALGQESSQGNAVLVVENFDALLGQGATGAGVGDLLKPVLNRGDVRFLGTTTPEGVRKIQDRDAALLRCVTLVEVNAPSVPLAIEMLRGIATRYEEHHRVRIGEAAIVAAVQLAKRYVQDRALPDSAIDLLDEASARKRVEIEGVPADVDNLIRRLEAVRAQEAALSDDDDEASVRVRQALREEAALLEPKVTVAKSSLESRRGALAAAQVLRRESKDAHSALEKARKDKDFARLGELEHVTLPDLDRRLAARRRARTW
jgi:ATP-dependent Clp protease ATP-binding subunit ClpB